MAARAHALAGDASTRRLTGVKEIGRQGRLGFRMRSLAILMPMLVLAAAPAAAAPSLERGETLLQRHCARCHAVGKTGRSPVYAAPPMRELGQRYPVENLAEALAEGILTGHPAMPEFRFGPDDVLSIIRYLDSIQARKAAGLATLPPP